MSAKCKASWLLPLLRGQAGGTSQNHVFFGSELWRIFFSPEAGGNPIVELAKSTAHSFIATSYLFLSLSRVTVKGSVSP